MGWTIRGVQTFIRFVQVNVATPLTAGAGLLAIEAMRCVWADAFASKPAPTGVVVIQCRRLRVSDGNSPNCLR
ncbi:hypothetical protein PS854_05484 [Pseudomonas fluorescens]|uniref:Uncharacterized protein n=1 Tax=Pseudomonas fluorescens TaxID=294 RepID=A0A5E7PUF9_PSEFL|nr:hypothetical protein PS854_05484 [Pseudomonas fluorescens]